MLITSILMILLLGFALLCVAMQRNFSRVAAPSVHLSKQRLWLLRISGTGLNLLALFVCIFVWGMSRGLVYWFGSATMVVFTLVVILTYRPRLLRWLCR
ncbi:hypothetical protein PRUB_b1101 [Pseudoalteromonas rubra]|uniref:DUF3325 domain-containing protein n=1 Tax=Pseudoalteromonas rubra TaxID=43658 RepID=A0A8T0C174_9GAMM|nr:DUF3325 domain-containing protein [Pseudoalteromonas rubra]KAF7781773.1 hypothetical protein PRUB_b1101 [Pseudoalteromonas rubra]